MNYCYAIHDQNHTEEKIMAVPAVVAKIPWKQLIVLIPDVVKAARDIWKRWDSKPKPEPIDPNASITEQISKISSRIQSLENNEASQSKVVSEIADQLQGIAIGLKETAARQTQVIWLSIGASILSICAVIIALVK